jgi:uncharacterized protein (DUF433 family)
MRDVVQKAACPRPLRRLVAAWKGSASGGIFYGCDRRRRLIMGALRKRPIIPAEIVSDPSVMSGAPIVRGTRVQAETILTYLRAGHSSREIFEDYPSLPIDGIDAAIAWAEATYGPDWKDRKADTTGSTL